MKKLLFLFLFTSGICLSQDNIKVISGSITDGRNPIPNVTITTSSADNQVFSDEAGKYQISASVGDIIKYSYQGMKMVKIKVEDVTKVLNITMIPDIEELEEVTVYGSNRKSQQQLEVEYPGNQNIIKTAYGFLNAETAPGNIKFLSEDEINPVAVCILDLLRNEFAGVRVQGSCLGAFGPGAGGVAQLTNLAGGNTNAPGVVGLVADANGGQSSLINGKVFIRGASSLFNPRSAIFDVDGQIFTDAPIWIDVKNIKRLAILNNFATTTQYGSAGAGGVVVVNTVNTIPETAEIYDYARLRNNYVSGPVLTQDQVLDNGATYLKDLYASNDINSAKNIFSDYEKKYSNWPFFYIDAQRYFHEKWGAEEYSDSIIENRFYLFEENPVLLKALAYSYDEQGRYMKANDFYKRVFTLRPSYGQSYMDMANSYRDLRKPKEAAAIYTRFKYLVDEGMVKSDSTSNFETIFNREYNNFLMLNKSAVVKGQEAKTLFIEEEDFTGTRLVFEWNDSEAEFDLQFVNPQDQYFVFKHSLADNEEVIAMEKENGYSSTEYLIDDSLPGTWKVNLKYHGNKSLTPTYLKATIYQNYGSFSQRKEVYVYKLSLKGVNQELFALQKAGRVASR